MDIKKRYCILSTVNQLKDVSDCAVSKAEEIATSSVVNAMTWVTGTPGYEGSFPVNKMI